MRDQFHNMLAFILENDAGFGAAKARTIASYFNDLKEFLSVSREELKGLKTAKGRTDSAAKKIQGISDNLYFIVFIFIQ